ncbi:MAG TPA: M28 family peptidase [Anaerolineae bacterium]|nr:M28 family peptidase [Anaerolineae bacterium]
MNEDELRTIDRAICGDIWVSNTVDRNLETLCQDCGSRFAGSDSERCAVNLITRLWQEYGLSNVHTEPFPFTAWKRGTASLEMISPARRNYPCIALPYAPMCDLEAEIIDLGYGLEADFQQAGDAVRGKIALIKNGVPPAFGRPVHRMEKYMRAKEAGAVAFVFMHNEPGMLAPTGSLAFDQNGPLNQALPSVGIAHEVGMELHRWAERGPVQLHLRMDNQLSRSTSWNVVGDIPGQNGDDQQMLVIGAHLDGHDISQAAVDNGSGVVAITETARVLAAQHQHLPRTVRFVCFGVEELGLLGAYAYTREHQDEMDRIQFLFNLDSVGSAGPLAFGLQNYPELVPYFQQLSKGLAAELNILDLLVPFSDQFPFVLQGVPAAFISSGETGKRGWGHTIADTLDKVNKQNVRLAATSVARLALRLVNDVAPWPGRRRTPDEVKKALQAHGVEQLMRMEGVWPF